MTEHTIIPKKVHLDIPLEVECSYPRLFSNMMENGVLDALKTLRDPEYERMAVARVDDDDIEFSVVQRPLKTALPWESVDARVCGFRPVGDYTLDEMLGSQKEYFLDRILLPIDPVATYEFVIKPVEYKNVLPFRNGYLSDVLVELSIDEKEEQTPRDQIRALRSSGQIPFGILLREYAQVRFALRDKKLQNGLLAVHQMIAARIRDSPPEFVAAEFAPYDKGPMPVWLENIQARTFANPDFEKMFAQLVREYTGFASSPEQRAEASRQYFTLDQVKIDLE